MKPDREKRSAAEYSFEYFESVESRLRSRKSGVESWKDPSIRKLGSAKKIKDNSVLARRVPSNFGGNQRWLGENPPLFLRQTGRRDKGETFVPCDGQKARELFNIFAKRFSFARGLTTRRFSARYSRFPGFRLFPLSLSLCRRQKL